jgi:hypothetical protein
MDAILFGLIDVEMAAAAAHAIEHPPIEWDLAAAFNFEESGASSSDPGSGGQTSLSAVSSAPLSLNSSGMVTTSSGSKSSSASEIARLKQIIAEKDQELAAVIAEKDQIIARKEVIIRKMKDRIDQLEQKLLQITMKQKNLSVDATKGLQFRRDVGNNSDHHLVLSRTEKLIETRIALFAS